MKNDIVVMVIRINHLHDVIRGLHQAHLDGNQVAVNSGTNPTAHSSLMSPFGYLVEQASLIGKEANSQLDDMTSNNFASVQGDSGMTLYLPSVHLTECVATTIPADD